MVERAGRYDRLAEIAFQNAFILDGLDVKPDDSGTGRNRIVA